MAIEELNRLRAILGELPTLRWNAQARKEFQERYKKTDGDPVIVGQKGTWPVGALVRVKAQKYSITIRNTLGVVVGNTGPSRVGFLLLGFQGEMSEYLNAEVWRGFFKVYSIDPSALMAVTDSDDLWRQTEAYLRDPSRGIQP